MLQAEVLRKGEAESSHMAQQQGTAREIMVCHLDAPGQTFTLGIRAVAAWDASAG